MRPGPPQLRSSCRTYQTSAGSSRAKGMGSAFRSVRRSAALSAGIKLSAPNRETPLTSFKHLKKHRYYKTARPMMLIRSENVVAAVGQRSYRPCAHGQQESAQEIEKEETSSRARCRGTGNRPRSPNDIV